MTDQFNEEALIEAASKVRLVAPKRLYIPAEVISQVSEELNMTRHEAAEHIRDMAIKLMKEGA